MPAVAVVAEADDVDVDVVVAVVAVGMGVRVSTLCRLGTADTELALDKFNPPPPAASGTASVPDPFNLHCPDVAASGAARCFQYATSA